MIPQASRIPLSKQRRRPIDAGPVFPGQRAALQTVQAELEAGETLFAFLDDIYCLLPPERVRPVYDLLAHHLHAQAHIRLNSGKTRIWNASGQRPPNIETLGVLLSASLWRTRACTLQVRKESDQSSHMCIVSVTHHVGYEQAHANSWEEAYPPMDKMSRSFSLWGNLAGVCAGQLLWILWILILCLGTIICKEMIMGICMHFACEEIKARHFHTEACEFAMKDVREWWQLPIMPPCAHTFSHEKKSEIAMNVEWEWWQLPKMPSMNCEDNGKNN